VTDKLIIDVRMNEYAMRDENPNVPWSSDEIVADALECAEAGATVVHFHGRDGRTGGAVNDTAFYAEAISGIREASDVLIHTTLGYVTQPPEDRLAHLIELAKDPATRPDIAPVDMASINVDIYDKVAKRFTTDDLLFENPTKNLQFFTREIQRLGIKTIHTCWNIACSRTVAAFIDMGLIEGPAYVALLMSEQGLFAGHPGTVRGFVSHLDHLPRNGDVVWLSGCYPGSILPLAGAIIAEGGHVTLGLGDYAYPELGRPRNADLVRVIAELARNLGREVATPEEAREILGLPARTAVAA
jgi:3-keto-5-aminohexanoate cleavage enzyme